MINVSLPFLWLQSSEIFHALNGFSWRFSATLGDAVDLSRDSTVRQLGRRERLAAASRFRPALPA
ncbi:MAG: hypothetical protein ABSG53_25375, partial [Thermoguttaceae bacterium]